MSVSPFSTAIPHLIPNSAVSHSHARPERGIYISMKSKLLVKTITLLFLCAVSVYLIWPNCAALVDSGKLLDTESVRYTAASSEIKSLLQEAGIPLVLNFKSYDLAISNPNNKYNISYTLTFSEIDPIMPYLANAISSSTHRWDEMSSTTGNWGANGHPGLVVGAGDNYLIQNIPANIPITDKFGIFYMCDGEGIAARGIAYGCPPGVGLMTDWTQKTVDISACPNIDARVIFAQIILNLIFWIVVINSIFDFFEISPRKENKMRTRTETRR